MAAISNLPNIRKWPFAVCPLSDATTAKAVSAPSAERPPPFLRRVWLPKKTECGDVDCDHYPLSLPLIRSDRFYRTFEQSITIIVGENGAGKSTILEAIATMAGFSGGGGAPGMRAVEHWVSSGEGARC
jgi:ABC-type multidrug transport system fused ATPase/permease subunit